MPKLLIKSEVIVTPLQLARLFTELDSKEMVAFFNEATRIAKDEWKKPNLGLSWMYIDVRTDPALSFDTLCDLSVLGG